MDIIRVNLPDLASSSEWDRIYNQRDAKILWIDWHVKVPYHGPPPHLHLKKENQKVKAGGLGYAPFGWIKGWKWARKQIQQLLEGVKPWAVVYGEQPHIRNGWGFNNDQRDPAVASYNDTLGILGQAINGAMHEDFEPSDWVPEVVAIPDTPGSAVQSRGVRRAKELFPTIEIVTEEWLRENGEVPDEPDEPEPVDLDAVKGLLQEALRLLG